MSALLSAALKGHSRVLLSRVAESEMVESL